jgi:Co/Zn/Cd efflux system component
LLVIALIFHYTVIRAATSPSRDADPLGWRRLAAVASVASWFSVLLGGMWIGNL